MKNFNARERTWKLVDCLIAERGWQGSGRIHLIYYLIEHPEEGKSWTRELWGQIKKLNRNEKDSADICPKHASFSWSLQWHLGFLVFPHNHTLMPESGVDQVADQFRVLLGKKHIPLYFISSKCKFKFSVQRKCCVFNIPFL